MILPEMPMRREQTHVPARHNCTLMLNGGEHEVRPYAMDADS